MLQNNPKLFFFQILSIVEYEGDKESLCNAFEKKLLLSLCTTTLGFLTEDSRENFLQKVASIDEFAVLQTVISSYVPQETFIHITILASKETFGEYFTLLLPLFSKEKKQILRNYLFPYIEKSGLPLLSLFKIRRGV